MNYTVSEWNGYKKIDFVIDGRESFIVCPKKPLPGNPWVWRTEFFSAFNYPDMALLEKGWHLAYHCASNMYGCPEAVEMFKSFYDAAVNDFEMNPRPALFGFSRGGLYATNFALKYPECAGMLYLDAPVLDILSWPGGKGKGCGEPACWEECKNWYKLTEETAADFKGNPLDSAEKIAELKIPVLLVCGAVDKVVPYDENGKLFYDRVKKAGGIIQQIIKPDCDHHPHSLFEPAPIVSFVESTLLSGKPGLFSDIKMNAVGDSITVGTYMAKTDTLPVSVAKKPWCTIVGEKLGFECVTNYGINGTAISATSPVCSDKAFSLRFDKMCDGADVVMVAGGTNDFGTDVPLGTPDDKTDISFYGGLYVLCRGLKEKYPSSTVVFVTPITRTDFSENKNGSSLSHYRKVIKDVALTFGFSVIDGDVCELSQYLSDGAHPTPEGHEILGNYIAKELKTILFEKHFSQNIKEVKPYYDHI